MRTILLSSVAALALTSAGFAQTPSNQTPNTAAPAAVQPNNSTTKANSNQRPGVNIRNMLQKSGYTDIRISPTSFLVHAKDANGNQIVMSISPDSFTEVTDLTTPGQQSSNSAQQSSSSAVQSSTPTQQANAGAVSPTSGTFVTVPTSDELSSLLIGTNIYNNDKKDIGQIKDVALNHNGNTAAYIVSVGGFLGMGEHYVAVKPSAVNVNYDATDKKWHASMNATANQLSAAPEFKYTGAFAH